MEDAGGDERSGQRMPLENKIADLKSPERPGNAGLSVSSGAAEERHRYVPHIDGLRCLAILPVVLFHYFPKLCPGGFVGVDVFFVISGYLITGGILSDLSREAFSIRDFYVRRIKRIVPAYLVLIVFVLAAGFLRYPLQLFQSVCRTVEYSVLFATNLYFNAGAGYFEIEAHSNPLLNLWSLGVEEQFYLVVPVGIWALWRARKGGVLFPLGVLCALSFAACVAAQGRGAMQYAFYMLPCRAWELLAGGILAALPAVAEKTRHGAWWAAAGAAAVLAPCFLYDGQTRFPGVAALPVVAGAVLLIRYGNRGAAGAALSHRAAVGIGKVSYSLYLWHWPVYVLLYGDQSLARTLLALLATAVFSYLSWRMVETPIRRSERFRARHAFGLLIASSGLLFVLCQGVTRIENRNGGLVRQVRGVETWAAYEDRREGGKSSCTREALEGGDPNVLIKIGDLRAAPSFVLWGDSMALALLPGVDRFAARHGRAGYYLNVQQGFTLHREIGTFRFDPEKDREPVLRWLEAHPEISTVLMANLWYFHLQTEQDYAAAAGVCERLRRAGKQLFAFQTPPRANRRALWLQDLGLPAPEHLLTVDRIGCDAAVGEERRLLQIFAERRLAHVVPLREAFSDGRNYHTGEGRDSYYWDTLHLNERGAIRAMEFAAPLLWGAADAPGERRGDSH